jgi:hypothetical protein
MLWLCLFVLVVAVFQGWMAFAGVVSDAHDPAPASIHQSATLLAGMHGSDHSHEDDSRAGDRAETHQHGHNAADHSHDKPSLIGGAVDSTLSPIRNWRVAQDSLAYPSPYFVFERPPKSSPMY